MQRRILTYPDPFLSTEALPAESVDGKIRELIRDMFETMVDANGVGLAATQVGVGKRVIVVEGSPGGGGARPEAAPSRGLLSPPPPPPPRRFREIMPRYRAVFLGTPTFAVPSLAALARDEIGRAHV